MERSDTGFWSDAEGKQTGPSDDKNRAADAEGWSQSTREVGPIYIPILQMKKLSHGEASGQGINWWQNQPGAQGAQLPNQHLLQGSAGRHVGDKSEDRRGWC